MPQLPRIGKQFLFYQRHMVTYSLLSDPSIALGRSDVPMSKHFTDIFQGHAIIEHHVRERMTGKVRIKRPFNPADCRKFFQIDIVPEIAVDGDQTVIDLAIGMIFVSINQFLHNRKDRHHFGDLSLSSILNQPLFT